MLMMLICVKCSSLTGIQIWNSKCVVKCELKKKKKKNRQVWTLISWPSTHLHIYWTFFSFLFFFSNKKEKCEWFQVSRSRAEGYGCLHSAATLLQAVNPNHIKGLIGFTPTQWDSSQSCGSLPLRKQSAVQMTIAPFYPPRFYIHPDTQS